MAKTLFEAIGCRLGQKAAQAKNAFELMGGSDQESLRAEIRLGRDLAAALLKSVPLVEDNDLTKYAAQIGQWLRVNVKDRVLPFTFEITAEAEPIALALPGGPVFVSWPLLNLCGGERDAIAFILAHEMGHIVLRHAVDRLIQDAAVSLFFRQSSARLSAITLLNKVGQTLLRTAYSAEDELKADTFAITLLQRAGGDVSSVKWFLEKVESMGLSNSASYFATHPPPQERLINLQRNHS